MITIDGSHGEGGGQMLRTALALSAISGEAFRMTNIRAGRDNPGLKAQHVAAIKAVQKLCGAVVDGAELHSTEITFFPKLLKGADVEIDVGTAGSITLVLQAAILPALFGLRITKLRIIGGTDVPNAPTIDYFTELFVPFIRTWCESIDVKVLRRGYLPVGQGIVELIVKPKIYRDDYETFELFLEALKTKVPAINSTQLGHLMLIKGSSQSTQESAAEQESKAVRHALHKHHADIRAELVRASSPGSATTLWALFALTDEMDFLRPIRLGVCALGTDAGVHTATELQKLMSANAPVDPHLADQLVPLLGLRGGQYKTSTITEHTKTNVHVVNLFCPAVAIEGTAVHRALP